MADSPALDIFSIDTARLVDEAFGPFKVFPGIQPLFEARTSREQHGPAKQGRNEGNGMCISSRPSPEDLPAERACLFSLPESAPS